MASHDPSSSDRDVRRARQTGDDFGYSYGDGMSPHPMYGQDGSDVPIRRPVPPAADEPDAIAIEPLELDLSEHGQVARSREDRKAEVVEAKRHRAGRNLPAAIGVGVLLAGIVLGSLFLWRPAFVGVIAIGAAIGVWEMVHAIGDGEEEAPVGKRRRRILAVRARPSLIPLLGGCLVMPVLAWFGGVESLVLGLLITVLAVLVWRLSIGPAGFHRDMAASTLIAVYVPFLLGFAILLAHPSDGRMRVLVTLACVILSDTGGYAAGVFFGKHPMAPTVSPKKSWEGFAGSIVATAVGGALLIHYIFHEPLWHGAVIGLGISVAAVLGDLAESMIKRDLGVKDMSKLLPGHGGLMDRLDSVVFAAPAAFMLMTLLT
jgi:phosphatidate cytidylyltransferase